MIWKNKPLLLLIGLSIILITLEIITPKPLSWQVTFSKKDKNPFGAYILDQLWTNIFPGKKISHSNLSASELTEIATEENLFILTSDYWSDTRDTKHLLSWIEQGNTALIASSDFSGLLADTLKVEVSGEHLLKILVPDTANIVDSVALVFTNKKLNPEEKYLFSKNAAFTYFSEWDTLHSTVLALNSDKQPVLLSYPIGKGKLLLSATPMIFTNYYLLKDQKSSFASGVLSYLPVANTQWTNYYHLGRQEASTPLRYILSQPSLKWAYYFTMIGLLLFIFFEAKRKQKPIPIIKPLPNDTVDFTETIGTLFLQKGNHKNLADKKIIYFLEHVRTTYNINTSTLDEAFCKQLASKSGRSEHDTIRLIKFINHLQKTYSITPEELLKLNSYMERFYTNQ